MQRLWRAATSQLQMSQVLHTLCSMQLVEQGRACGWLVYA